MEETDVVLLSEIKDVTEAMKAREKRMNRHFLWAVLGVSPAAVLPMLGLLGSGAIGYVMVLGFGVVGVELWRGLRVRAEWHELRELKETLEEGIVDEG